MPAINPSVISDQTAKPATATTVGSSNDKQVGRSASIDSGLKRAICKRTVRLGITHEIRRSVEVRMSGHRLSRPCRNQEIRNATAVARFNEFERARLIALLFRMATGLRTLDRHLSNTLSPVASSFDGRAIRSGRTRRGNRLGGECREGLRESPTRPLVFKDSPVRPQSLGCSEAFL